MKIKFIFLLLLIAQIGIAQQYKTDSDGKIIYKVESGDGWYSIARKFNISYSELRMANKNLSDKLSIGQTLKVPAKLKANDPFYQKNEIAPSKPSTPKYHKVERSETLFSISKKYNLSVEELKALNNLKNNSISVGQNLIVGKEESAVKNTVPEKNKAEINEVKVVEPKKEIKEEVKKEEIKKEEVADHDIGTAPKMTPVEEKPEVKKDPVAVDVNSSTPKIVKPVETADQNEKKFVFSNGRKEVNETGVAAWIEDEEINPNKYYALHRTAPTGTIIKVTNRMNSRSIFVKVIGRLPETGDNEGILIKLSKASADKLGVIDQRFQVQLLYGVNEK